MGTHDAFAGDAVLLAPFAVAFAPAGGASCRDANFLNALNISLAFSSAGKSPLLYDFHSAAHTKKTTTYWLV